MSFDIRKYFPTANGKTAGNIHVACPNCQDSSARNPALSINLDSGAYHCFKCDGEKTGEIRKALGDSADAIVPTAWVQSPPAPDVVVSPVVVKQMNQRLLNESRFAKNWLGKRGFSDAAIAHYQLGIKRLKRLEKMWWCVSIPFPADSLRSAYYLKLRVQPWTVGEERPPQLRDWDQKGISAQVWFTHNPPDARQTYLCEGEWDAMLLGWMAMHEPEGSMVAVATFTAGCDTVPSLEQLQRMPGRVTIFYDRNDKPNEKTGELPGVRGARKVAAALNGRGWIAQVPHRDEHAERHGWDVNDAILAGFSWEDFQAAAAAAVEVPATVESKSRRLTLVTNNELQQFAPDHIDWLVPDLLPANELFVLAASPRAGKSLLAMLLAKGVALGEKFLGRTCTQGSVIYVATEDSDAKIKQRQIAQGWGSDMPVYWLYRFKLSQLAELRELAIEVDARLIIFDTFSRIRDDGTQESSAEISLAIEPLQDMANELFLAVLLVHHTTKVTIDNANTVNIFDSIRGSSAIRGVCRGSWVLACNERLHRLYVEHGFGDDQDLEMRLDRETLQWKSIKPWNPKSPVQSELILDYLRNVTKSTISEISKNLGLNADSVSKALWRLQNQDSVWKKGGKKGCPAIYHYTQSISEVNARTLPAVRELSGNQKPDSDDVSGFPDKIPGQAQKSDQNFIDSKKPRSNENFGDIDENRDPHNNGNSKAQNADSNSTYNDVTNSDHFSIRGDQNNLSQNKTDHFLGGVTLPVRESDKIAENHTQYKEKFPDNSRTNGQLSGKKGSESPKSDQNLPDQDQPNSDHPTPNSDHLAPNSDHQYSTSQQRTTKSKSYKLQLGDFCRYVGPAGGMAVQCHGRKLKVLEVRTAENGLQARCKAEKWVCDYWIDFRDLKRL